MQSLSFLLGKLALLTASKVEAATTVPYLTPDTSVKPQPTGSLNFADLKTKLFTGSDSIYGRALVIITLIAGLAAVFFLIYYGIQYIIAGGSADKTKAARAGIINAVIGIVVVTAAYGIIRIAGTVGASIDGIFVK